MLQLINHLRLSFGFEEIFVFAIHGWIKKEQHSDAQIIVIVSFDQCQSCKLELFSLSSLRGLERFGRNLFRSKVL